MPDDTPMDELRAELVRALGFNRASETQLKKTRDILDAMIGSDPPEEPEPPEPEPPEEEEPDEVLEDETVSGDLVIPAGELWQFKGRVEIDGNLQVEGTHRLRPGAQVALLGADPEEYVGGGMTFAPEFRNDIGIWVAPTGKLDWQGTSKRGWNRTGTDPSWDPEDEYWIAPTEVGDFRPRRWFPGDPIPRVLIPKEHRALAERIGVPEEWIEEGIPTEVMNVTRDVVITGPGHIHIHAHHPQRVEHVRLQGLGVSREGGPVLGRYGLHLHHGGDASRGTMIRGVAMVDTRGRGLVPHESHGIEVEDFVSVNGWAEALWWDLGDHTNDLTVDRLCVSGVRFPTEVYGGTTRFDAVRLVSGENMTMRNSVVSGARGNRLSIGWHWNTKAAHRNPTKWVFEQGNMAHNNEGPGIRFWLNDRQPHHVQRYIGYRNGEGHEVETGAYLNPVRYSDCLMLGRVHWNANPRPGPDGHVPGMERCRIESSDGPALTIGHRRLHHEAGVWEAIDCEFVPAEGHPKVRLHPTHSSAEPWHARFVRCGITPEDIEIATPEAAKEQGTHILIQHEDGREWEILVEGGERIVRERSGGGE